MDKDYQTKMEFVVRTHDDKGLYKDFYQFGHEILDDDIIIAKNSLRLIYNELRKNHFKIIIFLFIIFILPFE